MVSGITPAKSDLAISEGDQAVIGDGHAMGVAAQIVRHIFGTTITIDIRVPFSHVTRD